jgi:hypothetical protein
MSWKESRTVPPAPMICGAGFASSWDAKDGTHLWTATYERELSAATIFGTSTGYECSTATTP